MVRREAININYLLLLSSLLSSKSVRDWHDSSSIPATSVTLKRLTPFRLGELALHVLVRSVRSASNYPSSQISGKEPRCASYSFDLSRIPDLLSSKVQKRMTFLFPPPPLRALWQRRMRTLKPDGLKTWQVCAARERLRERELREGGGHPLHCQGRTQRAFSDEWVFFSTLFPWAVPGFLYEEINEQTAGLQSEVGVGGWPKNRRQGTGQVVMKIDWHTRLQTTPFSPDKDGLWTSVWPESVY